MKHIFIEIGLRICADETSTKTVIAIDDDQDPYLAAKEYVKDFWGDGEEEDGSEWVTYPNEILGRLNRFEVLTEAEYDVLKRFL